MNIFSFLFRPRGIALGFATLAVLLSLYVAGVFDSSVPTPSAPSVEIAADTPSPTAPEPAPEPPAPQSPPPVSIAAVPPEPTENEAPQVAAFRLWLQGYLQSPPDQQQATLQKGLALAEARRGVMAALIQTRPEAALKQSLPLNEWQALPAALKAAVERPFSEVAKYTLFPVCPGPGSERSVSSPAAQRPLIEVRFASGEQVKAFVYGGKTAVNSKDSLPLQGIALDGVAALWDGVLRPLSEGEAAMARTAFPSGQPDESRSFVTGEPLVNKPVTALAGGKRFTFANLEELSTFDAALAKLDTKPGPRAGSRAIFSLPYSADAANSNTSAFNFAAAESQAEADATDWTITPKTMFLIRATFANSTEPVTQSAAATVINGTSNAGTAAAALYQFSYNKTYVTATVSESVYQLDRDASYYAGSPTPVELASGTYTSKMSELMDDARAKFRSTRNGGDSTINIGTLASGEITGGSLGLGSYDIVGVTFVDIGCYGNGVKLAGLASVGGRDLWMQGSNDPKVYVHEMGHIYGLGHSNFWQTTDNSVVGSGSEKEYGDPYDVMGAGELPKGHFHPQAKQKLGWLSNTQWSDATIEASKMYRIYQHDDPATTGDVRGVRITKAGTKEATRSASTDEYYWIGYRPTYTENQRLSKGAYLLWQRPPDDNSGDKSCLLDTTPLTSGTSASGKADAALDIGRTYSDPTAGIHITPVGRGGSGSNQYLDVSINLGTFTSVPAPTLSSISGGTLLETARTASTFTATPANVSGDTLAYFWDAGDGTLTGGTGASAATFSHAWTTGGSYSLSVTVSNMKGSTFSQTKQIRVYDPAQNFTPSVLSSGTLDYLNAIAASPTLLVAVGAASSTGAVIRSSPDGVTWTERAVAESTLNLRLHSILWNGSRFVAAGEDSYVTPDQINNLQQYGVIYTSETGLTWTRSYSSGTNYTALRAVASGGGVDLAVGDKGTVLRSLNGGSWSAIVGIPTVTSGTMSCRSVAFGGGTFALTARTSALSTGGGVLCTSTDGIAWTERTSGAGLSTGQDLEKIAWLNGKFVTSGWFSKLKTSTDGALTFSSSLTGSEEAYVLGYASGLFFASGVSRVQSGTVTESPVNLYSTDGSSWVQSAPQTGMEAQKDGVFFNNRLVSVGTLGSIWQSGSLTAGNHAPIIAGSILSQTTLNARSPITFAVTASDEDGDALTYHWDAGDGTANNTSRMFTHTWVAGGTYDLNVTVNDGKGGSSFQTRSVRVIDPARTFTNRTSGTTGNLNAIAASPTLLVAVGKRAVDLNSSTVPVIRTSTDGITWTERAVTESTLNLRLHSITWNGSRFIAVGEDSYVINNGAYNRYSFGVIYTSETGLSWTRAFASPTDSTSLNAVASGNGVDLAAGDSGTVLRLVNGGTWTAITGIPSVTSGSISSCRGLSYGGGKFILTTRTHAPYSGEGVLATSPDGLSWSEKTSGMGIPSWQDFGKVVYANDKFLASGWFSKLKTSTNLGETFSTTRPEAEEAAALGYVNGLYFALGVQRVPLNSSYTESNMDLFSTDALTWVQSVPSSDIGERTDGVVFQNTIVTVGTGGQIWQSGTITTGGQSLEIFAQPTALTVNEGLSATFTVAAAGSGTLSYRWKKDTGYITGATAATFTIPSAATINAGTYSVLVTDSSGTSLESSRVTLAVNATTIESVTDLVSSGPPSQVSLVKGSEATLNFTLKSESNVLRTTYTIYSGSLATALTGTFTSSGSVSIPLKSITTAGSYFVRFVRTFTTGAKTTDNSEPFSVALKTWDAAAGNYETLLASDDAAASALNDGSVYRGLLTLIVTKTGSASGRLLYNEATPLQNGPAGERVYTPITRSFAGKFVPKPGEPSILRFTPKLGTTAQSLKQSLSVEFDLSEANPTLKASLSDSISLASGTCVSSATGVSKVTTRLTGDLTALIGKYLLLADQTNSATDSEPLAYVQTQVLSSGKVLWNSRLKGYAGTGSAFLNTTEAPKTVAQFYEGRLVSSSKIHNATSLLSTLNFTVGSGSLGAASFGAGALEKQASYLTKEAVLNVLTPVYKADAFASGTNSTGVTHAAFLQGGTARWCGSSATTLPSFFPSLQHLHLSLFNPQNPGIGLSYNWTVTVSSTGIVKAVAGTASDANPSPALTLRLDRTTGLWSGSYLFSGIRRTLLGVSLDPGTLGTGPAAQGWMESGTVPALTTGSWTIAK